MVVWETDPVSGERAKEFDSPGVCQIESQSELRTEAEGGIFLLDVTEPAATRTR